MIVGISSVEPMGAGRGEKISWSFVAGRAIEEPRVPVIAFSAPSSVLADPRRRAAADRRGPRTKHAEARSVESEKCLPEFPAAMRCPSGSRR